MRRPPIVPIGLPDAKLVTRFANRLAHVTRARSAPSADDRFDRWLGRAVRSPEATDAAFAAAQQLRDLDEIDAAEAAYVFDSIYDEHSEDFYEADPEYQRLLKTFVDEHYAVHGDHDDAARGRLEAALEERSRAIESQFLAARGETTLATLRRDDPDAFSLLCAEGQLTLIEDKPAANNVDVGPANQDASSRIGERILALAATETVRDTLREHSALWHAVSGGDPASAVAAVQEMRELGMITALEAHGLLDEIVGSVTADMGESDREWSRLQRTLESHRKSLGLSSGDPWPDDLSLAIRVAEYRHEQRWDRLHVLALRRFGEHAMANLMLTDPDEYNRRCAESVLGEWAINEERR
jgi:hypothetical protein